MQWRLWKGMARGACDGWLAGTHDDVFHSALLILSLMVCVPCGLIACFGADRQIVLMCHRG